MSPSSEPAATDAEWRRLAEPRPVPVQGAPHVSLAEVQVLLNPAWPAVDGVSPGLAVQALASAALLSRRDLVFVERRRFQEAAAAEHEGRPHDVGAPLAGISPGADFVVSATWAAVDPAGGAVELRITDAATGETVAANRTQTPSTAGALTVSRAVVASITATLDSLARLPRVPDEEDGTTPSGTVSDAAVVAFLHGLAYEDRWAWDAARRRYLEAIRLGGSFPEAEAALARTARLRMGGTLGES